MINSKDPDQELDHDLDLEFRIYVSGSRRPFNYGSTTLLTVECLKYSFPLY
jgi:hypothetical protein